MAVCSAHLAFGRDEVMAVCLAHLAFGQGEVTSVLVTCIRPSGGEKLWWFSLRTYDLQAGRKFGCFCHVVAHSREEILDML